MRKIFTFKGWRYEPEDEDLLLNCNDKVELNDLSKELAIFKVNGIPYEIKKEGGYFSLYEDGNLINSSIACDPQLPYFNKENPEDIEKFLEYITSIGLILYT